MTYERKRARRAQAKDTATGVAAGAVNGLSMIFVVVIALALAGVALGALDALIPGLLKVTVAGVCLFVIACCFTNGKERKDD